MSAAITFEAFDYRDDRTFAPARYELRGSVERGWTVARDGATALELGPGYRALRVRQCGVCSTDLARHFLPFPLPQVIGHEVVARDEGSARFVVEINASHAARGVAHDCAFCRAGLATHCPERVTLGIDALPGGFGLWILAPVRACLPVPDELPDETAVLVEPFAAALHAVTTVAPRPGDRIAVLGPRRLGMLVVAALDAVRAERGADGRFSIDAVVRDPGLAELATSLGADDVHVVDWSGEHGLEGAFDVVVDTTGNPAGLADAVCMARREVHLKSTHGEESAGLAQLTALVVDELSIAPYDGTAVPDGALVAWLARAAPPAELRARCDVRVGAAAELAAGVWSATGRLPRADCAVADSRATVDAAIRPVAGDERSLVAPRGRVLLHPDCEWSGSSLLEAVTVNGMTLSSSRCGDFARALGLLATPSLRDLGDRFVTHRFDAADLPRAFEVARSRECIKAVVEHER